MSFTLLLSLVFPNYRRAKSDLTLVIFPGESPDLDPVRILSFSEFIPKRLPLSFLSPLSSLLFHSSLPPSLPPPLPL